MINTFLFWLLAALLVIEAYNILFHGAVPNVRTAPAIRNVIIGLLQKDQQDRKIQNYTIVDVGSGNGLFTRHIAQSIPQANVIGLELSVLSAGWARFMKRFKKIDNLDYKRMNFLDYNFAEADAIVMYLIPEVMQVLGKKFHEQVRPGTLIISNKFRLGDGWEPLETLEVKTAYLHQKKVYIYRKEG